jgi:hypothetical protein
VPRFRRFPVFGFGLREYSLYSPDFSFRIMSLALHGNLARLRLFALGEREGQHAVTVFRVDLVSVDFRGQR